MCINKQVWAWLSIMAVMMPMPIPVIQFLFITLTKLIDSELIDMTINSQQMEIHYTRTDVMKTSKKVIKTIPSIHIKPHSSDL